MKYILSKVLWFPAAILFAAAIASAHGMAGPCAQKPPAGSPSRLYTDGSRLCWNGKPLRLSGYYTIDLATRDGYDYSRFLNTIRLVENSNPTIRHGVNFTRIWATGNANNPDCLHTPADQDPAEPSMTMPFQFLPGEVCSENHSLPKYNMCISNLACQDGVGFNPVYQARLQSILTEAKKNGIIVELVLFDAFFLGRHQDTRALYATNPWNPLNNNMSQSKFRRFPADGSFAACNKLYQSTDSADASDDAFPEFYDICKDAGSTDRCDKTLNCLGLIQKSYVNAMVDLVRNTSGASDHVIFEIMNRPTFDKRDSRREGFDLARFKRWNDVVGRWIKCRGDNNCANSRGDYLVVGEVGLAEFSDLACTRPSLCPNNPLEALGMPNIDIVDYQGHTWKNSSGAPGPCATAMASLHKYNKPVIIDTDSALQRTDKCQVESWVSELKSCGVPGQVHFLQLDGMTFGYPAPKECNFRGIGNPEINLDFDERYVDCFALDALGAAGATYLSDIVSTGAPQSCPHSVTAEGITKWCASTCGKQ